MRMLARREAPAPYPRFGYVLEFDGAQIGVIVLIFSTQNAGGDAHVQKAYYLAFDAPHRTNRLKQAK